MRIMPIEKNCVIIDTQQGSIHVYEENGFTKIIYYDHFQMEIRGKHKQQPQVILDSDEFLTELIIKETESKWVKKELPQEQEHCGCRHNFMPGKSIPIDGWKSGKPICAKCKKPLRSLYPKPHEIELLSFSGDFKLTEHTLMNKLNELINAHNAKE